jgi:hypothetical protein
MPTPHLYKLTACLLLIFVSMISSGCAVYSVSRLLENDTTYLAREAGALKRFKVLQVDMETWAPPEESISPSLCLVDADGTRWTKSKAKALLLTITPHRLFTGSRHPNLFHALKAMYGDRLDEQDDLWIVSLDPVVVAQGTKKHKSSTGWNAEVWNDTVRISDNYHLIGEMDLQEKATNVRVFSQAAGEPFGVGTAVTHDLPKGTTLGDLLNRSDWN